MFGVPGHNVTALFGFGVENGKNDDPRRGRSGLKNDKKAGLSGHVTLKQAPRIDGSSEDIKSRSSCYLNSHNAKLRTITRNVG
jgi:hypothetical protein